LEYIYAALLLHKIGKKIDEASVARILEAAGATPDQAKIKSLVAAISEINIDEVLKQATITPSVVAAAAPTAAAAAPATPAKEEKKKEEKEEKEEALAGLSALFG
jgi:large subunit ribosomal protein L12